MRNDLQAKTNKAFTLIELLIVVAIIAILAAIAIPNFLEAQVRSKVSRVKADMRTLATAIETYTVDHNRPPVASQWINGVNAPLPVTFNNRYRGLTTPVSYITTVPVDVFFTTTTAFPVTPGQPPSFEYEDYTTAVVGQQLSGLPTYNLFSSRQGYTDYFGRHGVVNWQLMSAGPDRFNDFQNDPSNPDPLVKPVSDANAFSEGIKRIYDPTNGTVSRGDVARTNNEQRN